MFRHVLRRNEELYRKRQAKGISDPLRSPKFMGRVYIFEDYHTTPKRVDLYEEFHEKYDRITLNQLDLFLENEIES